MAQAAPRMSLTMRHVDDGPGTGSGELRLVVPAGVAGRYAVTTRTR